MEGEGWSGNAVTETRLQSKPTQAIIRHVVWQERQTWNGLSFVTFNSNSSLRACITWRALEWKCSGEREGSLSSAKSSSWPCGGLGRGKRNRAGNIVHHKFCLIIAIFILEYPSAGSEDEMRETTCKGQTNCLSNSNSMPDLNREIFSHHFIAFSYARGHLVSRASRLQLSQIRRLYWLQQGVMTWLVNECLWCTRSLLQLFFQPSSRVKTSTILTQKSR